MTESIIYDINLAAEGRQKINWVKQYMPMLNHLNRLYSQTKPFKETNLVVTIHLEAKTAYLAEVLHNAGANVIVTGSNPLSTQNDIAAALVKEGITVMKNMTCERRVETYLDKALDLNRIY
jgi:adenosylhomocysteinase